MNNKIIRKITKNNGQYKITIPKVIVQMIGLINEKEVEISVYRNKSIIISKVKK